MPDQDAQQFLNDLDKKLWTAADRLRSNLDAAVYKHAVLGLIFLKYVSDSFEAHRNRLVARFTNEKDEYFLGTEPHPAVVAEELEERDYYIEKNVFWVPALARWKTLQDSAKLPPGTEIEVTNGKKSTYKITSIGKLLDDALDAIERENPRLKNVLNKDYTRLQIDPANLSSLIDLIATIPFEHAELVQSGVLTPQARTAHQPTHDSKAQKSPIRIKIAASRRDSDIRRAPASKNATAMPPRAARPLLSMFCLIVEGSQHEIVKEKQQTHNVFTLD
jgi:type I restriction-modification system DNA methylase subunit